MKNILPAQFLDEGRGVAGDVSRELDGVDALQDDVVRLHRVGAGERWGAREELEHEHTQRPVVGADVMALVEDHFGRHVLGRAAKSPRLPTGLLENK